MGLHHVAYATRDIAATVHFYESLMGFALIHSEGDRRTSDAGEHRIEHFFFDIGDGESIAFFVLDNIGEQPDWTTDISTSVGLPEWVNHCAFRATEDQQTEVRQRMEAEGIAPHMEVDHGWCHSVYYMDPNQILVELCRDTPGLTRDTDGARQRLAQAMSDGLGAAMTPEGAN